MLILFWAAIWAYRMNLKFTALPLCNLCGSKMRGIRLQLSMHFLTIRLRHKILDSGVRRWSRTAHWWELPQWISMVDDACIQKCCLLWAVILCNTQRQIACIHGVIPGRAGRAPSWSTRVSTILDEEQFLHYFTILRVLFIYNRWLPEVILHCSSLEDLLEDLRPNNQSFSNRSRVNRQVITWIRHSYLRSYQMGNVEQASCLRKISTFKWIRTYKLNW